MKLKQKSLLGIKDLQKSEIDKILSFANKFKKSKKFPKILKNEVVAFLFFENSTRTKLSFQLAAKKLGAEVVNFDITSSSITKGESLLDTINTLKAMGVTILIVRHSENGFAERVAKISNLKVINAGDGTNEHPSQALTDIFTLKEKFNKLEDLKIGIVGDVKHSRVARSDVLGFDKYGCKIFISGPKNLIPIKLSGITLKKIGTIEELIKKVDVVIMLRIQFERMNKKSFPSKKLYFKKYGLTEQKLSRISKTVYIMHPGPINREVEIESKVADSKESLILEQVANGVPVRMGIFYWLTKS